MQLATSITTYGFDEAARYDKVIGQPVYRYYVARKTKLIKGWFSGESYLLDVGCGTGVYTASLANECKMIVGLDESAEMVERALLKAKHLGLDNVGFIVADAAHLPFKEASFDLIFSVNMIHHIANENSAAQVFMEQQRCGKSSGHVLIYDLNQNSLGWSTDAVPKMLRRMLSMIFRTSHYGTIDNEEEGTRIVKVKQLLERKTRIKSVLEQTSGFIPTFCPKSWFKLFYFLEKAMESAPIVRRYGAHTVVVGELR